MQPHNTTIGERFNSNYNGVLVPPLDFKNESIMNRTREWTVKNINKEVAKHEESFEDQNSSLFNEPTHNKEFERKNLNTLKNHINMNSAGITEENNDKGKPKYSKLIRDLEKIEAELDKHEIQLSIKGQATAKNKKEKLDLINDETEYLKK